MTSAVFDDRLLDDQVVRFPTSATASQLVDLAEGVGACALALKVPFGEVDNLSHWLAAQIQRAVQTVFPAWLPGAEAIDRVSSGGAEALAALAKDLAARTGVFGPFAAAAAMAALRGGEPSLLDFPLETIVREGRTLLSSAFGGKDVILILDVSSQRGESDRAASEQAVLCLASQASFRVWLHGAGVELLERFVAAPGRAADPPSEAQIEGPLVYLTPLAGAPAAISESERRLEAYLLRQSWATRRSWNQSWAGDALDNPIRIDLLWAEERLAVEFDGDEHRQAAKYEADRRRDRRLQAAGYRVLRFTNAEIERDIVLVASEIERFLTQSRERF